MNHTGTLLLETPRLRLRPLSFSDAEVMYTSWATDMDVVRYLSWRPHTSLDETKRILSYWISNYPDPKFYIWGIQLQRGQLIGTISIHSISDPFLRGEVGYALAKPFWGKGYVTEALQAILDHAFGVVGFNRIEAHHAIQNPASGRVMEKCGMQKEGLLRQYYRSNEGLQDTYLYAILRKDWQLSKGIF
jgi:ribosomal-protein-alanine N-acetyltransferase